MRSNQTREEDVGGMTRLSRTRLTPLGANGTLAMALAVAAIALAAACGGGSKALSAGAYFGKIQDIADETKQKETDAQPSEEESASLSPDELKAQAVGFLGAQAAILDGAVKQIDALKPPADVRNEHDAFVTALTDLAGKFRDFSAQAADLSPEQIEDFFNTEVFSQATFASFDETCSALEQVAKDKSIDVDLNCTE